MKSFLDRFRRKGGEDDASDSGSELQKGETGAAAATPAGELAPSSELKVASSRTRAAAPDRDKEVRLELGDFLHRIPQNLLRPGPHEVATELRFDIEDLSSRIAKGQTTVNLAEIYRRIPQIFRTEVRFSDNIEVRFPWQKLMNLLKETASNLPAGSGLTVAAAESLAQKLRSRRPPRNIPQAHAGSVVELPSAPASDVAPTTGETAPSESGGRARQPDWMTGSGEEKSAPVPATTPPSSAPERKEAPAKTGGEKSRGAQLDLSLTGEPEESALSPDDLLRSRNSANLQLAQVREEYERKMTAVAQERATLDQERARALSELERTRGELANHVAQLEAQEHLSQRTSESAAKAITERDQLQKQLLEKAQEMEALRVETEALKKGGDAQLAPVLEEREALLTQVTLLTSQLEKAMYTQAPKAAVTSELERSKKEYQRQIEELQRRIIGFESVQREAAQELTRERETRIKSERALGAADRARQEASALIETMRNEARRDAETAARKREADAARVHQETQEKLDALAAANAKALAERDALEAQLKAATDKETAGATAESNWEARAVASLEGDIADYRKRIKTLLGERDAIAAEKTKLAADLATRPDPAAFAKAQTLAEEYESQRSTLTAAQAERDELRNALAAAQARALSSEQSKSELAALSKAHADAQSRLEAEQKLHRESSSQSASAKLRAEAAEASLAQLRAEMDRLQLERAASGTRESAALGELQANLATLSSERDAMHSEREKLRGELAVLKSAEREKPSENEGAAAEVLRAQLGALEKSLNTTAAERDELRAKLATAADAHQLIEAKHAQLGTGHAQLLAAREAALADATRTDAEHQAALQRLHAELETAKRIAAEELQSATSPLVEKQAEFDRAKAELEARTAAGQREAEEMTARVTALAAQLQASEAVLRGHETAAGGLREELETSRVKAASELSSTHASHADLVAQFDRERTAFQDTRQEMDRKIAEAGGVADQLAGRVQTLEAALASAHETAEQEERAQVALRKDLESVRKRAAADLEAARASHDTARAVLQDEQSAFAETRSALEQRLTDSENGRNALTAQLAALGEKLSARETTLREKEAATIAQQQEHERALTALREEAARAHGSVLADLAQLRTTFADEKVALQKDATALAEKVTDSEHAVDELALRAHTLETTIAARDAALQDKDAAIDALEAEHQKALARQETEHEKALATFTAEKDRQLAAVTADRAKSVAALTRERDELASKLASETKLLSGKAAQLEKTLSAQIAGLTEERDESRREAGAVAERLAVVVVDSDQKLAALTAELEALKIERTSVARELAADKEAHRAQSAVFAREFKGVVKQRDDALNELASAQANAEELATARTREQAAAQAMEVELEKRFERDAARVRRERDAILRQRDELRDRIARMVEEQKQMLEELAAQTASQAPRPNDIIRPVREPKEANVIDINEADEGRSMENESGIDLQRIRPVLIAPPKVRVL